MKYNLFICLLFPMIGLAIPNRVKIELKDKQIEKGSILFCLSKKDCSSCFSEKLNYTINLYKNVSDNIYFIGSEPNEINKIKEILLIAGLHVSENHFVTSNTLYGYLHKTGLSVFTENRFISIDKYQNSLDLKRVISSKKDSIELSLVDSLNLNNISSSSSMNDICLKNSKYYSFNKLRGEIVAQNNTSFKTTNLYDRVDKEDLFRHLNLCAIDSQLTTSKLLNSTIPGSRFIEFLNFSISNDSGFVISSSINYCHLITLEEKKEMMIKNKMAQDLLEKDINQRLETTIQEMLLIYFDKNLEFIKFIRLQKPSVNYAIDYNSPLLIKNENIYGKLIYIPQKFSDTFAINNSCYFTAIENSTDAITLNFGNEIMPEWFAQKKVMYNYSSAFFQNEINSNFLTLNNYPFSIKLDQDNINLQTPLKTMKSLSKKENNKFLKKKEPGFFTVGAKLSKNGDYLLFFKSRETKQIYYSLFDSKGNYLKTLTLKMNYNDFEGSHRIINGKLIRMVQDKLFIYTLN